MHCLKGSIKMHGGRIKRSVSDKFKVPLPLFQENLVWIVPFFSVGPASLCPTYMNINLFGFISSLTEKPEIKMHKVS